MGTWFQKCYNVQKEELYLMASKMLHTCLRVENLEKSIAFYQDAF